MEKSLARAARIFPPPAHSSGKKMSEERSQAETADSSPTPPLSVQNAVKSLSFAAVSDYKRTRNRRDKSSPIPPPPLIDVCGASVTATSFWVLSVHSVRYRPEITCNQLEHFLMGEHGRATFFIVRIKVSFVNLPHFSREIPVSNATVGETPMALFALR